MKSQIYTKCAEGGFYSNDKTPLYIVIAGLGSITLTESHVKLNLL